MAEHDDEHHRKHKYIVEFLAYLTANSEEYDKYTETRIQAVRIMTRFGLNDKDQDILLTGDRAAIRKAIHAEIDQAVSADKEVIDIVIPYQWRGGPGGTGGPGH